MKLADCAAAQEIHRRSMADPAYRFWYALGWLPNQASIAWLRLRVRLGGRDGPG